MADEHFTQDRLNAPEDAERRALRGQLRLSSRWVVVGKDVRMSRPERSDGCREPAVLTTEELKKGSEPIGKSTIYVSSASNISHLCPFCGRKARVREYEIRTYHHVPDMGCECRIVARVPKLRCDGCGRTPQVPFPVADPHVSYTRDLAEAAMRPAMHESRKAAAASLHISTNILDSIIKRHVRAALVEQDLSDVREVYLDETQFGHGQDYVSTFIDQRHRVIYACRGHGKEVLEMFSSHLVIQGGHPDNVRLFSTDMSMAYEAGIKEEFRNATLVWDRFHLVKSVNEAVNDVRKRVLKKPGEKLRNVKYVVLKHFGNLNEKQSGSLESIRLHNPELALAFDMKEVFSSIVLMEDYAGMRS